MAWGDAFRDKLRRLRSERVILQAAGGTMLEMAARIWDKGGLSDGGTIRYNEDYEVWATAPPWPRKGNRRGKTGRKINSTYYPSYLAGKRDVDRGPFELVGDLRKDWLGGVTPSPREENELQCVIDLDASNAKKAEGLAKGKGEFLRLTVGERQSHTRRVSDLWRNILST